MTYTRARADWHDLPATDTPITAANLEHIEQGIADAHTLIERFAVDVKHFGAVGDGVTDDAAAIRAALAVGDVFFPAGTYLLGSTVTVPAGRELCGVGVKSSTLRITSNITALAWTGGEGEAIRRLRLQSWYVGARTAWEVDVTNPTKIVIEDFELAVSPDASGTCGIRLRGDSGQPGNHFMPQLSRVWIRNGRLVVNQVSDGHMSDSFVWGHTHADVGAIDFANIADGWSFNNVDVVPCTGSGSGYLFTNCNNINITGGYIDGSYEEIITGYGIKAVSSGRIFVAGYRIYNVGRSGIYLNGSHGCSFAAVGFLRGNKANGSYPDIDLVSSTSNVFQGTAHAQTRDVTNKGGIYREDTASTKNNFGNAILDTSMNNYYATPYFVGNVGTRATTCKPESLWTRHPAAANVIAPPAACLSIPAPAAWPAANTVIAHRFHVTAGGVYQYANFRVDSGSGNMQAAVLKMDGSAWTRVANSGVVSCTTGDKILPVGVYYLEPGEYAAALWCDNANATFRYATNSGLTASRLTAEWVDAAGVGTSGTLTWSSAKYVGGLTVTI